IIAGRDVTLTTTNGDVVNERTVTSHDSSVGDYSHARDFVDNAARIEAANKLVINAGRDVLNTGGVLKSGGDMAIDAKRDVSITSVEERKSESRTNFLDSTLTQHGAEVSSGAGLTIDAGRDVAVVASKIDAKGDVTIEAKRDVFFGAAADEEHSYFKDKKETRQEDHVSQVGTTLEAGGKLTLKSGKDMTLIASDISTGKEAYLHADGDLQLLAAQDRDYSLYDMKKSGGWGSKKTQRDEVTQITHIGTEIKTGGNLTLSSGGDQRYQVAKLNSDRDIILDSGGNITFEGVKDLHDESHTKSDGDLAWFEAKGSGTTDETLRQSQLVAQGRLVIKAAGQISIDIKQVDQQSVSQSIDAMVKADPQLAWLKQAEARGDIDWRQVKEIHESFKYDNSGLGAGAKIAIAILMSFIMGPAGLGLVSAGAGGAVATSLATTAVTSTISNKGNLGAAFKETFSADSLKGAAIAGFTAGMLDYADTNWFAGASEGTKSILTSTNFTDIAARVAGRAVISSSISTAIGGGSFGDNLGAALVGEAGNVAMATGFDWIGDITIKFPEGSLEKVVAHALMGGLLSKATGGDFATGAAAAGLNEALMNQLISLADGNDQLHVMMSQLTGLVAAAAVDGDLQQGADIAKNATTYNYLNHRGVDDLVKELKGCRGSENPEVCRQKVKDHYAEISSKTSGHALFDCKGFAECNGQRTEAEGGTLALEDYDAHGDLNAEERAIIQDFQDSNHTDEVNATHVTMLGDHKEIAGIVLTGGLGAGVKTVGRAEGTATAVGDDLKNLNPTSALTDAEAASRAGSIAKLLDDASHQLERYIGSFSNKYKPPTVIGAVDPWTGKIVTTSSGAVPGTIAPELKAYADSLGGLGVKTACGNTLGRCAEFRAANELLLSNPGLKLSDIKFTAAVRPRTGEVVPRCENCTNIFGAE
ncbi:DUF637 domain-containing protein, partial [Pseudomonas sp. GM102]|uniref:DUF637 domain-containing protein n=1 Tax=Pseudomonas sp. GM102 TaxID=1144321 RepID=UPI000517F7EE